MIAEIHNKISRSGNNLSDRLEDQLTGDFFGAMNYLPFQIGFRQVLEAVRFQYTEHDSSWKEFLDSTKGFNYELRFWVRHTEGEIDLILDHPDVVIGIEVKYYSGLSSEDENPEEPITPEESCHQLARYSRLLQDIRGERSAYLVFVAPFQILLPIEIGMKKRSIISQDITLGFLAWQNILEQLQSIEVSSLEMGQRRIIDDLRKLLTKKGFERFRGCLTGIKHFPLSKEANSSKGKSQLQLYVTWPIKTIIQEDNYVFIK